MQRMQGRRGSEGDAGLGEARLDHEGLEKTRETLPLASEATEETCQTSRTSSLELHHEPRPSASQGSTPTTAETEVDTGQQQRDEKLHRWLERKERLRRKKEESAACGGGPGTYGVFLRAAYGSQDKQVVDMKSICADHGLPISSVMLLGCGSFGRVFCGQMTAAVYGLEAGERVAIKMVRERFKCSSATQKWTEREIQTMMIPRHEHLVHLFKAFEDKASPVLCMEYCPGGSLHEAVHGRPRAYVPSALQRLKLALDIARGMAHLHSHSVLHRDLKPSNVLLLERLDSDACCPHAKVSDFGLARFLQDHDNEDGGVKSVLTIDVGSPVYMAPELCSIEGEESAERMYDLKADVYSYAILCNEMLTEKHPFEDFPKNGRARLALAVVTGKRPSQKEVPDDTPSELLSVIQDGWATDPCDRPDFEAINTTLGNCYEVLADVGPPAGA